MYIWCIHGRGLVTNENAGGSHVLGVLDKRINKWTLDGLDVYNRLPIIESVEITGWVIIFINDTLPEMKCLLFNHPLTIMTVLRGHHNMESVRNDSRVGIARLCRMQKVYTVIITHVVSFLWNALEQVTPSYQTSRVWVVSVIYLLLKSLSW